MAMTITRTSMTDDDGTGTTGTVWNAAWVTALYDQIDALHNRSAAGALDFLVTHSAAGATNSASLQAVNNSSHGVVLQVFSSTYTPSGDALADGARLVFGGAGGLSITTTDASADLRIYTGGFNQRWKWNSSGHFLAVTDNTFDIGASGATRPRNVYIAGALTLSGGTLLATSAALTNGAAAQTATMTNGPTAGNPTKWVPVNDNGTTRYVPMW